MKKISQPIAIAFVSVLTFAAVVAVCVDHDAGVEATKSAAASSERAGTRERSSRMIPIRNSNHDQAAALRSVESLPEDERLPMELRLAKEWGSRDFDAAREWVLASRSVSRHDLLVALGLAGLGSRPLDAMKLVNEIADDRARPAFVSMMVQAWAAKDMESAAGWVGQCDPLFKKEAQMALVIEMAQKDPQASARYVAMEMEPGGGQDQAALTVAARWSCLDPQAARSWALSLPESDLQQRVLAAVESLSPP